jgi:hypothetical protein
MKREIQEQYEWSRRSKRYKAKYMNALNQLYKDVGDEDNTHGRSGTDQAIGLVNETGDKALRNP